MEITRSFAGAELKITLTPEEIAQIVAECATITVKNAKPVPVQEQEPAKKFTMPKVTNVGRLTDHMDDVKAMVEQDFSYSQIAQYFGVSLSTVNKYIKMWGLSRPSVSKYRARGLTIENAMNMMIRHDNGDSMAEIARDYGCPAETVAYWIQKAKATQAA